ncbi:MAG: hypothetical protein K1X94_25735 [Sandaracinaceae bacterium]|nr:hypothetical protein [Sandaracinaceae bacterium]
MKRMASFETIDGHPRSSTAEHLAPHRPRLLHAGPPLRPWLAVALGVLALCAIASATLAHADPPDAGAPAPTDSTPTVAPPRITPIVRRLVSRTTTHEHCRVLPSVGGEDRYLCTIVECHGACLSRHVEVTIGIRRDRGRVIRRERRELGDIDECGCCDDPG